MAGELFIVDLPSTGAKPRSKVAQGNALGHGFEEYRGLKARPNHACGPGVGAWFRTPFQGLGYDVGFVPRALPWAGVGCPFGAPEGQGSGAKVAKGKAPAVNPTRIVHRTQCYGVGGMTGIPLERFSCGGVRVG